MHIRWRHVIDVSIDFSVRLAVMMIVTIALGHIGNRLQIEEFNDQSLQMIANPDVTRLVFTFIMIFVYYNLIRSLINSRLCEETVSTGKRDRDLMRQFAAHKWSLSYEWSEERWLLISPDGTEEYLEHRFNVANRLEQLKATPA